MKPLCVGRSASAPSTAFPLLGAHASRGEHGHAGYWVRVDLLPPLQRTDALGDRSRGRRRSTASSGPARKPLSRQTAMRLMTIRRSLSARPLLLLACSHRRIFRSTKWMRCCDPSKSTSFKSPRRLLRLGGILKAELNSNEDPDNEHREPQSAERSNTGGRFECRDHGK